MHSHMPHFPPTHVSHNLTQARVCHAPASLQFPKHSYDVLIEGEGYDRTTLKLQKDQVKL